MTREHTTAADDADVDAHQPPELAELLADPAVWAEPSDDLEDKVVAAVAAEVSRRRSD